MVLVLEVVFHRYAASGASAIQPFDFRLHLLPMLHVCVNIHAYDFDFEELYMPMILSKSMGILSLLAKCISAVPSLSQSSVCCSEPQTLATYHVHGM
jgi:hypothetical protein